MGNSIEARKLIKDLLNNNLTDPYPGTRSGNHFYDKTDGLNLTRAKTFPKGFITSDSKETELDGFGSTGHSNNSVEINIWYFVKDKISYTENSVTYKEEDYVELMINKIIEFLRNNKNLGSGYHIKGFGTSEGVKETKEGTFRVYYDVVPVTVYWDDIYG